MRFAHSMIALLFLGTLSVDRCNADWNEFWKRFDQDVERNYYWPQPFVRNDQMTVRQTFASMVAQGWQVQHTLSDYHFDSNTHELNQAGMSKVYSILRTAPAQHQTVFVYSGFDASVTDTRIQSIQQQLSQWIPEQNAPAIVKVYTKPLGVSGSYADAVSRKYEQSIPAPVLTGSSSGGSTSGGSGN